MAKGAIAALAASAGADRDGQLSVIDRLRDGPQKTTVEMTAAWAEQKQRLYTERLAEAAGDYRLVMLIEGVAGTDAPGGDADPGGGGASGGGAVPAELVNQPFVLGVTALLADGRQVKLEGGVVDLTVSGEELALVIPQVGQLKDYPRQEVQALPLERVDEPLILRPDGSGTWRGQVALPAGQTFHLALEPVAK